MTTHRLTKDGAEALGIATPPLVVTKDSAEALGQTGTRNSVLTRTGAEALTTLSIAQSLTRAGVEILVRLDTDILDERQIEILGLGWAVRVSPAFSTLVTRHVTGRELCFARMAARRLEIELTFDVLQMDVRPEYQGLVGFFGRVKGASGPFVFLLPVELGFGLVVNCRFADDWLEVEEFEERLWRGESVKIMEVKTE